MFKSINPLNLLYVDIETAGIKKHYADLTPEYQEAWQYHCERNKLIEENTPQCLEMAWQKNVALLPEFSQTICVSFGKFTVVDEGTMFKTQTFYINEDRTEEHILKEIGNYIESHPELTMIAHAGKDFDYPFMVRRFIINNILPPKALHIVNKKPWEIALMDTKEIWKFGGYRSAALASICAALGIRSPKEEMSGKDTHSFFWNGKYSNIARYCSNDVRALASVVQRICNTGDIEKMMIQIDYV